MKRALAALLLLASLVVGFLLVGPFIDPLFSDDGSLTEADATPLPSGFVEITTHCGLGWAVVEFQGELWTFGVEDEANLPEGWGTTTQVVRILEGVAGPVLIGPGGRWTLVPYVPPSTPRICI